MDSIRYEALKRASQMHTASPSPTGTPQGENQQNKSKRPEEPDAQSHTPPHSTASERVRDTPTSHIASKPDSALFADKEKLLILLLILILGTEEERDPTVILALLYLII